LLVVFLDLSSKNNSNISPLTTALLAGDGSLNHNITISDTPLPLTYGGP